ncbi:aconitate hydratase, partial [bacterium]|nr:aconitate hydratase [bacterium]
NLINFGIIPFTFVAERSYDLIDQEDELEIDVSHLEKKEQVIVNKTRRIHIPIIHLLNQRDVAVVQAGGALAYAKKMIHG